jgi:hypothetical protein
MTNVYITIDTEYSAGRFARDGASGRDENFKKSIWGGEGKSAVGIGYQLEMFSRYGVKANFFVDPMPALVWGTDAIADIVRPIVSYGQDVQLHMHCEWLEFAGSNNPLGQRTGRNIKDFDLEEQRILLTYAMETLMAAGAPRPVAFRAGNYGANDDTLRALADLGIAYETSYCPGVAQSECDISPPERKEALFNRHGTTEVPIGAISIGGDRLRHAQITALSAGEMVAAIRHARDHDIAQFTLVSHSFELLSRDRTRANHIVKRRFDHLCRALSKIDGAQAAAYSDAPPVFAAPMRAATVLPHNPLRTLWRQGEQFIANRLYGAS